LYYIGLPKRYKDSVRVIRPGYPIFLYNYENDNRLLYGPYKVICVFKCMFELIKVVWLLSLSKPNFTRF
jgi:hypothetical protein